MNNKVRLLKSKEDLVYNIDEFGRTYNLLFITGLVGSGKSTLAKKISKEKKAIILEQDYLYGLNVPKNNKIINEVLSGFYKSFPFAKEAIDNDLWKKKCINLEQDIELKRRYNEYLIKYSENNKDKLFIIEGIDVFKTIKVKDIEKNGIIIKRTSALRSLLRRIKRDGINNIFLIISESKCYYIDNLKRINKFLESLMPLINKQKKVLFIANSNRHIKLCHIPYLKMFKDNGYQVHVLTNEPNNIDCCDKKININFKRNPFGFINLLAVFKVRKFVRNEQYDLISCHTPIGGFLGRCSVIKNKVNTKVIYTAHGFHFYKGSSIFSWIIYYPVEKFLSRYTNLIVTMNREDYNLAKSKFKCPCVKINGIGLDTSRLFSTNANLKNKLNIKDKFIVTYIAEISNRKNQPKLLKTIKKYDLEKENIVLLLVGDSRFKNFYKKVKKYKNVIYIDFVNNIADYIKTSDLLIFPSKQEGLPQSVLEALYFNKDIITFDIRGCNDINSKRIKLIDNGNMDLLIKEIIKYKNCSNKAVSNSIDNNIDKYLLNNVLVDVKNKYNKYLNLKLK